MGASLLALAKSVYYIYFVRKAWPRIARGLMILNYSMSTVSYTHLTLPTNREV